MINTNTPYLYIVVPLEHTFAINKLKFQSWVHELSFQLCDNS